MDNASPLPAMTSYRVGDLTVDVVLRRVTRAGVELGVTELSFDLLLALIRVAPQPVSHDELMEQVWKGVIVSPETVAQRVKLLRQGLGDDAEHPRYIATLRGRGYRLVAAASIVKEADRTGTGAPAPVPVQPTAVARWLLWAGVSLAGIIAGILLLVFRSPRGPPSPAVAARTASVAVLPFANLTGDASKDYLADGMAEELITTLARTPGLHVPARSSSFAYKGRELDARQIGDQLGVQGVIEGSVRAAGERIRIDVQLIDVRDGFQSWTETYDRKFSDLLQLQDDIALAVSAALRVRLGSAGAAHRTSDVDAYNLFLQGSFLLQNPTADQSVRAVDLLSQAVKRDPMFARAFGMLADAHFNAYMAWQPAVHLDAAESAAKHALTIDADTAQAHDVLAAVALLRGHWLEMELQDRAMRAASDGDATSLFHRSYHLGAAGKLMAAADAAQQAYALAPANASVVGALAASEANLGRDEEAVATADRAVALGLAKSSPWLVNIYIQAASRAHRTAEAAQLLADAFPAAGAATPTNEYLTLERCLVAVHAKARSGRLDDAFASANRCLDDQPAANAVPGAAVHRALTGLWLPDMQPFRRDPRFESFANRLGLMEYWHQYGPPDSCDLTANRLVCR